MSRTTVVGLESVIAKLNKLNANIHANLQDVLKGALQEIVKEAKRLAPKRYNKYTKMFRSKMAGLTGYVAPFRRGNRTSAIGHLLEFGTVHAKAFPHLFPAFKMVTAVMGAKIRNAVWKARQ